MLAAKYVNVPARDYHRKAKKPTNFDKLLYFKRLYSKSEHLSTPEFLSYSWKMLFKPAIRQYRIFTVEVL